MALSNNEDYYEVVTITDVNRFIFEGPRANPIKLFYDRNLRVFGMSSSVCPWQAFSA
jgi:hypothetical protein